MSHERKSRGEPAGFTGLGVQSPGEDKAVEVDPLLFGDPGCAVEPLCCLEHLVVKPLDELLL